MDSAFFVPKGAILEWLNTAYRLHLTKIEETASGSLELVGRHGASPRAVLESAFPVATRLLGHTVVSMGATGKADGPVTGTSVTGFQRCAKRATGSRR